MRTKRKEKARLMESGLYGRLSVQDVLKMMSEGWTLKTYSSRTMLFSAGLHEPGDKSFRLFKYIRQGVFDAVLNFVEYDCTDDKGCDVYKLKEKK